MNKRTSEAIAELEKSVYTALETYSNVHRGSGHNSLVSTCLYEKARSIVLEFLGLNKSKYSTIFCTTRRAEILKNHLKSGSYKCLSSKDIGLPLGVTAIAVRKKALPRGTPFQTGGGTTRLVSPRWIIWANGPEKFEAGTPAIINVIAFARTLQLIRHLGKDLFRIDDTKNITVQDILYHDELENYSGKQLLDNLRKTLIGNGMNVPTLQGSKRIIYLDNAASTPTFTPVWNAFITTLQQTSSIQQHIIKEVRSICGEFLGAPLNVYDVIFASNTTEAINLVAENLNYESAKDIEPVVLNTLLEHNSNDLPWRMIPGISLIRFNVDTDGLLDINKLDNTLSEYNQKDLHGKKRIRIVAVSGASNVLGVFNNLEDISRVVHQYGAKLLVDAAQLIAHRKVEIERIGIDFLAFSAHKVYAPFGTGVLVVRKGLLKFNNAEMEKINMSGEENPGGIAALGKMIIYLKRIGLDIIRKEEQDLTRQALNGLLRFEDLKIHGIKDPESPLFAQKGGVISFHMKDHMSDKFATELVERRGINVRYGCHCAHLLVKYLVGISPLLEQFQGLILRLIPRLSLPGIVRVSFGIGNNKDDIDILVEVLDQIIKDHRLRRQRIPISSEEISIISRKHVRKQFQEFTETATLKVYSQL